MLWLSYGSVVVVLCFFRVVVVLWCVLLSCVGLCCAMFYCGCVVL